MFGAWPDMVTQKSCSFAHALRLETVHVSARCGSEGREQAGRALTVPHGLNAPMGQLQRERLDAATVDLEELVEVVRLWARGLAVELDAREARGAIEEDGDLGALLVHGCCQV